MKKMGLDIQRFNSTNKTTHYELSQYIANDKPTYLVDYNDDMVAIDTAIYEAKTQADLGITNAGIAQTTAENAQTTANTAVTNAGVAQTTADDNTTKIGDLANLTTANKANLVSAISEVNDKTPQLLDSYTLSTTDGYCANYVNGLNTYSTTETVCGTWIDGTPLYRKVIKVTSIDSASNNYDETISISNLNEIVNIGGIIKLSGNNTYKPLTTIFTDNSNAISPTFSISVYAITDTYISLSYGNWWKTVFDKAYIILEYTKTTD